MIGTWRAPALALALALLAGTTGCGTEEPKGGSAPSAETETTKTPTPSNYTSIEALVSDLEEIVPGCESFEIRADWYAICTNAPVDGESFHVVMDTGDPQDELGARGILRGLDPSLSVVGDNWFFGISPQSGSTLEPYGLLGEIAQELGAEPVQ